MDAAHDESAGAAATARQLGFNHVIVAPDFSSLPRLIERAASRCDEPNTFGAMLTMTAVADAVREHCVVALTGDGGDESFGGYTWALEAARAAHAASWDTDRDNTPLGAGAVATCTSVSAHATPSTAHTAILAHLSRVRDWFTPADAVTLFAPLAPAYSDAAMAEPFTANYDERLPPIRCAQRLDLASLCAGSILPKVDRASMGVGLELRAPFLDKRILGWALRRPASARELEPDQSKPPLRSMAAQAGLDHVLRQPKQGFSLRVDWSEQEPMLLDQIARSSLVRDGLLHHRWRTMLTSDHPRRSGRLFAVAILGAWLDARPCTGEVLNA